MALPEISQEIERVVYMCCYFDKLLWYAIMLLRRNIRRCSGGTDIIELDILKCAEGRVTLKNFLKLKFTARKSPSQRWEGLLSYLNILLRI